MEKIFEDIKNPPKSVGVIMDGNGRWAKKRLLPRSMGHRAGMERVKDIVRWSSDIGINTLTLYAFSTSLSIDASHNAIASSRGSGDETLAT